MLFYLLLHKLRFISFIINEHDDDDDDDMFFLVRRITSNIWQTPAEMGTINHWVSSSQ